MLQATLRDIGVIAHGAISAQFESVWPIAFIPSHRGRHDTLWFVWLVTLLVPGWLAAQPISPTAADTLATLQSVDAFITLQDGQPGRPGRIQFDLDAGWFNQGEAPTRWLTAATIEYTPRTSRFVRNMVLAGTLAVTKEDRNVEVVTPVVGWQQRWIADTTRLISVATILQVGLPVLSTNKEFNATFGGVLARSSGRNTLFVNGMVGALGRARINFEAFWLGYSYLLNPTTLLVGSYVLVQQDDATQHHIELGGVHALNDRFSVGPGFEIGLKRHADIPFSAGVRVVFLF